MEQSATTSADRASHGGSDVEPGRRPDGRLRRFFRATWPLWMIAGLGLVLRVLFITVWWPTCDYDASIWQARGITVEQGLELLKNPQRECFDIASGDAAFYFGQGQMLADGMGMGSPFSYFVNGEHLPSAAHPPGYPVYLAAARLVGLETVAQQRLASTVLGAAGVFLIGLVAQRLAGRRAGVIAAILAALYPMLWINDGKLMSESLIVPLIALVLLAAYSFLEHPRPRTAILLGAAIGAAALVRAESGALAWIMVPFLAMQLRHRLTRSAWLKLGVLSIVTTQLVMSPWTVRNLTSFNRPIYGSAGVGIVLLSGSCDAAYYDTETLGLLNFACLEDDPEAWGFLLAAIVPGTRDDESEVDYAARGKALGYIRENLSRTPIVMAARLGRMWDVYRTTQNADVDVGIEVRPRGPTIVGKVAYFSMIPFAIGGLIVLRRRRISITPFVAIFVMISAVALLSFALTRYRVPAEVALVVLAAIGIDALIRDLRKHRRRTRGPARPDRMRQQEPARSGGARSST